MGTGLETDDKNVMLISEKGPAATGPLSITFLKFYFKNDDAGRGETAKLKLEK